MTKMESEKTFCFISNWNCHFVLGVKSQAKKKRLFKTKKRQTKNPSTKAKQTKKMPSENQKIMEITDFQNTFGWHYIFQF